MARPADICDARALRLAQAFEALGSAWRDYANDDCGLEPCDACGEWLPGSGTVSEVIPTPDGYEDCIITCVVCEAKKPLEGDY